MKKYLTDKEKEERMNYLCCFKVWSDSTQD